MTTKTELITKILDDLNRSDMTAGVSTAIDDAKKFYDTERLWFNERRAVLGVSTQFAALPDDYLEVDEIKITQGSYTFPLHSKGKIEMDKMDNGSSYTDCPINYCIYDSQLRFWPIPDQTYSITMSYQFILPELTGSSSNVWTNELGDLIRYRAQADVYRNKLHNSQRAQSSSAQEQIQLANIKRRSNKFFNDAPIKGWL